MSKSTYKLDFDIGELVFLKTDPDFFVRMVVEVVINYTGITYIIACGSEFSKHTAVEITRERPAEYLIKNN